MGLVIPLSFMGVLLVGSSIYSLRNVILELFQLHLVTRFNNLVENEEERPLLSDLESRHCNEPESDLNSSSDDDLESNLDSNIDSHTRESSISSKSSIKQKGKMPIIPKTKIEIDEHSGQIGEKPTNPNKITQHRSLDALKSRTLTLSRSQRLPILRITGSQNLQKSLIISTTKEAIQKQSIIASLIVLLNIITSGFVFSYLEDWSLLQGFYFAYCSFMTIGIQTNRLWRLHPPLLPLSKFVYLVYFHCYSVVYVFDFHGE